MNNNNLTSKKMWTCFYLLFNSMKVSTPISFIHQHLHQVICNLFYTSTPTLGDNETLSASIAHIPVLNVVSQVTILTKMAKVSRVILNNMRHVNLFIFTNTINQILMDLYLVLFVFFVWTLSKQSISPIFEVHKSLLLLYSYQSQLTRSRSISRWITNSRYLSFSKITIFKCNHVLVIKIRNSLFNFYNVLLGIIRWKT